MQHAKFEFDVDTDDLMTIAPPKPLTPGPPLDVPADFKLKSSDSGLTGAIRVGAGIDVYATSNIAVELNTTYVLPFEKVGSVTSDYMSLVLRVLYRF